MTAVHLALLLALWGPFGAGPGGHPGEHSPAARAVPPRRLNLNLRDATPAEAQAALAALLESPVSLQIAPDVRIVARYTGENPTALLDAFAAATGTTWRRRLHIVPASRALSAGTPSPPTHPTGALVTADLAGLPANRMFTLLARSVGATLVLDGDFPMSVSLRGVAMPVERALDTVCAQVGAVWHFSYVIVERGRSEAPPAPEPAVVAEPGSAPAPPPVPPPRIVIEPVEPPRPAPVPPAAAPPTPPRQPREIQERVEPAVMRVLRAAPPLRREAVREAVRIVEEARLDLAPLPVEERQRRLAYCRPLWRRFHALYQGLALETRRELQPLYHALRRLVFDLE